MSGGLCTGICDGHVVCNDVTQVYHFWLLYYWYDHEGQWILRDDRVTCLLDQVIAMPLKFSFVYGKGTENRQLLY